MQVTGRDGIQFGLQITSRRSGDISAISEFPAPRLGSTDSIGNKRDGRQTHPAIFLLRLRSSCGLQGESRIQPHTSTQICARTILILI